MKHGPSRSRTRATRNGRRDFNCTGIYQGEARLGDDEPEGPGFIH